MINFFLLGLALFGSGKNRVTIREDIHHFRRITYRTRNWICMQWTKILILLGVINLFLLGPLIGSGRNRVTIREDIHHFRRITYVQKRKQIFMCICMQWTKILTSSDQCHKKLQEFWVRTDRGVGSPHKVDIFLKETKREARVPETLKLLQLQVNVLSFPCTI